MDSWAVPSKRPRGPEPKATARPASCTVSASDTAQSKKLLAMTARLAVQSAAIIRDHSAALQHTAILAMESDIVHAMMETGKRYHDERRTHTNTQAFWAGAPHCHIWASMVMALMKVPNLPSDCLATLKSHAESIASAQQLCDDVHVCRASRAFDGKCKVVMSVSTRFEPIMVAVLQALTLCEASIKHGAPPRTANEREILKLLQAMGESTSGGTSSSI